LRAIDYIPFCAITVNVMELASFGSLAAYIEAYPLSKVYGSTVLGFSHISLAGVRELAKASRQMVMGLAFLHRNHLIHCDLKPQVRAIHHSSEPAEICLQNVLVCEIAPLLVKISDFGLVQPFGTYTVSNAALH
jgi:serine/threonine protein kinase